MTLPGLDDTDVAAELHRDDSPADILDVAFLGLGHKVVVRKRIVISAPSVGNLADLQDLEIPGKSRLRDGVTLFLEKVQQCVLVVYPVLLDQILDHRKPVVPLLHVVLLFIFG